MKTNKFKKEIKKFDLDKFEVATLKKMQTIIGGRFDEPIDTNRAGAGSSRECSKGTSQH